MFKEIDDAIISYCTRISHRLQRATGLTNYFIAKIGLGIACLSLGYEILNYFHQFLFDKTPLWDMIVASFVLCDMVFRSLLLSRFEDSQSDVKPNFLMWEINRGYKWRIACLGVSILLFFTFMVGLGNKPNPLREFIAYNVFPVGCAIFWYFILVDPMPPGKSRIREWLDNLRRKQVPIHAGR